MFSRYIGDALFPRLYKGVDCVVLPTRGEGWGRPQMEAMSMGLPLITTNWSGPTAYVDDKVAYPLAVANLTTIEGADFHYFEGSRWAEPSSQHLKQLMRHVYDHPDEAARKGAAARQHVVKHFSPQPIAWIVARELRRVQAIVSFTEHLAATTPNTPTIQNDKVSGDQDVRLSPCDKSPAFCSYAKQAVME